MIPLRARARDGTRGVVVVKVVLLLWRDGIESSRLRIVAFDGAPIAATGSPCPSSG